MEFGGHAGQITAACDNFNVRIFNPLHPKILINLSTRASKSQPYFSSQRGEKTDSELAMERDGRQPSAFILGKSSEFSNDPHQVVCQAVFATVLKHLLPILQDESLLSTSVTAPHQTHRVCCPNVNSGLTNVSEGGNRPRVWNEWCRLPRI